MILSSTATIKAQFCLKQGVEICTAENSLIITLISRRGVVRYVMRLTIRIAVW
jgi:hypothetical protein